MMTPHFPWASVDASSFTHLITLCAILPWVTQMLNSLASLVHFVNGA